MSKNSVSIYCQAHTNLQLHPFSHHTKTLRMLFQTNISSASLRVILSNRYGDRQLLIPSATIALCNPSFPHALIGKIHTLTHQSHSLIQIPPTEEVMSDPVPLSSSPGDLLAISLYYPQNTKIPSGNLSGQYAFQSKVGDFTREPQMPSVQIWKKLSRLVFANDVATPITTVKEVIAETDKRPFVFAFFGDSITQQGTWTIPLTQKLYASHPDEISAVNLGIIGNRLCHHSPEPLKGLFGESGSCRSSQDLLSVHGLTHAVIALGTNDIGLPGKDAPLSEMIAFEDYQHALNCLVDQLHQKNVTVYGTTILPRKLFPPYNEKREALRMQINRWIRETPLLDQVLDFDQYTSSQTEKYEWFMKDGLHLSPTGGAKLAEYILPEIQSYLMKS